MTENHSGREQRIKTGGLIVAAGCSSRMGAHKMLLPLGKETVLRQGILTMFRAGASPVVVVVGRDAEKVRESIRDLPVETVENPDYAVTQMLDSVKMGLEQLSGRCKKVLFAPGDAPMYGEDTVRKLIAEDASVCVPARGDVTGHPVCFLADLIEGILAYDGPGGLSGALDALSQKTRIECEDDGAFLDADTPEDYEKLKQYCESLL